MYKYNVSIEGYSDFTEEQLYHLIQGNLVDGIVCVRSIEDSVILKSDKIVVELENVKTKFCTMNPSFSI